MASTIFIDESGYSGSRYADPQKALFVVASLRISPSEADELKTRFFPTVQAEELKHSQLIGDVSRHKFVLDFLSYVCSLDIAKVWVADKRYAGWLKVVEHLVEPFFAASGKDLYDNGQHLSMAGLFHRVLPTLSSREDSDSMLQSLVAFLKSGTTDGFTEARNTLMDVWRKHPETQKVLAMLLMPMDKLTPSFFDDPQPGQMDMAFGAALHLAAWWRSELEGPIHVIHDATANMSRQKDMWDSYTSASIERFRQSCASGMTIEYPISIDETRFEPSHLHSGLQLCDVLAGAIGASIDTTGADDRRKYAQQILERIGELKMHAVLCPETITPEGATPGTSAQPALRHIERQFEAGRLSHPRRHSPPDKKP